MQTLSWNAAAKRFIPTSIHPIAASATAPVPAVFIVTRAAAAQQQIIRRRSAMATMSIHTMIH